MTETEPSAPLPDRDALSMFEVIAQWGASAATLPTVAEWNAKCRAVERDLPAALARAEAAEAERDQAREVLARVEALCVALEAKPYGEQITAASVIRAALSTPAESPTVEGGQVPEPDLKWAEMFGVMRGTSLAADDETAGA